jgi:hypothetical protein
MVTGLRGDRPATARSLSTAIEPAGPPLEYASGNITHLVLHTVIPLRSAFYARQSSGVLPVESLTARPRCIWAALASGLTITSRGSISRSTCSAYRYCVLMNGWTTSSRLTLVAPVPMTLPGHRVRRRSVAVRATAWPQSSNAGLATCWSSVRGSHAPKPRAPGSLRRTPRAPSR